MRKDEAPFVFDVVTKQVDHEIRKLTGEEFVKQYFDEVDKTAENKVTSLQKYKAKSKAELNEVLPCFLLYISNYLLFLYLLILY